MVWNALEASVQTGDNRNIILWIVLAAVALILVVLCIAMSALKKGGEQKKSGKRKK